MRLALRLFLVLLAAGCTSTPAEDGKLDAAALAARKPLFQATRRAMTAPEACAEALDLQALMFCWEIDAAAKSGLAANDPAWKTRASIWMSAEQRPGVLRVAPTARPCFVSHLLADEAAERDAHHRPLERHVPYLTALQ